ncbi:MAG: hypothetical protein U0521_08225 [Anaerolineae bacterium]
MLGGRSMAIGTDDDMLVNWLDASIFSGLGIRC